MLIIYNERGNHVISKRLPVGRRDGGSGDMHRVRKDSFFEYQRIIASNGACVE